MTAASSASARPRTVLITGASAGIGAALARVYAAHGWGLALTARRADRLETLAAEIRDRFHVPVVTAPLDLADPSAPDRLLERLAQKAMVIDGLVNNAGYSRTGGFLGSHPADQDALLRVMLLAPVELTRRVLPGMVERGFGRVLNVASLAGLTPATAGDTLYGPTKSFLIKASQGLWLETRGTGVNVTVLNPGYTLTEFHDVNGSRAQVSAAYPAWMWMDADRVARIGHDACEAGRPAVTPGLANKALSMLPRVLPNRLALAVVARHARRLERL